MGALCLGEYAFTDTIYGHVTHSNLNEEFVRIREYQKTNWNQKAVVVAHKVRDLKEGNHITLLNEERDTFDEVQRLVPEGFHAEVSFSRRGWEYTLESMHIYVEEIEGLFPSIEVIADSKDVILDLFSRLEVNDLMQDSVATCVQKSIEALSIFFKNSGS